jgi:NRPS condensation-like uncharacterized protein
MNRFDTASAAAGTAQSPGESTRDLFPLPLSPFERYMILDDTAAYPMTFVLMIKLKGNLVREPFQQAVRFALERHPLLASHIRRVRGKGPCWVPVATPTPQIWWGKSRFSQQSAVWERIDLAREIGIRISVDADAERADVLFEFHHACTDGIGAVQFIGDLLAHYGQLTTRDGDELPEISPVTFDALRAREDYSTNKIEPAAKSFSYPYMLGRLTKLLLRRRPVPVARALPTQHVGTVSRFPAMISRTLDQTQVRQLKAVAARKGVTLNDLYLLETFRTIRDWNRAQGRGRDDQWLRIGMPTNLRTSAHDRMPAANVVSYMFLARRAGDCDRPDEMLAKIHRQTSLAVHARLGRITAMGLKHVQKVPGLLWCLLRRNRCFCSAILTNVGDIQRQFHVRFPLKDGRCVAGNVILEALMASPTIRPKTRLAICVLTYAGTVFIGLRCDPLSFTREQAEELADAFVIRLNQSSSNQSSSNRSSTNTVPQSNAA